MLEQDPGWKNTIALYKPACSRRALKGKNIIATPCNKLDQYENRSHTLTLFVGPCYSIQSIPWS